jgi:hypothetical protein
MHDVATAVRFLNRAMSTTDPFTNMFLPGVTGVHVTHCGDGWMRLRFLGYTLEQAGSLARLLLLPEPEFRARTNEWHWVYEGLPATEFDGGAGDREPRQPTTTPPTLRLALDVQPGDLE